MSLYSPPPCELSYKHLLKFFNRSLRGYFEAGEKREPGRNGRGKEITERNGRDGE